MTIRPADHNDLDTLQGIAASMKAQHEPGYFERCLSEQRDGNRIVLLAFDGDAAIGYAQLNWRPLYAPFRRLNIPEIQDLNVVPGARRKGIGAKLVEACEEAARQAGRTDMGISVGLYSRFGAAQRLYVQKGYVPDGAGVTHDDIPVAAGDVRPIDDLLTLKLVKVL